MLNNEVLNNWSCLPKAFALALAVPFEQVIKQVGHDGSELIWKELSGNKQRRSFHLQEMIDVGLYYGYAVIVIERQPCSLPYDHDGMPFLLPKGKDRFMSYLRNHSGVLIGKTITGNPHAVMWDGKQIVDPNGFIYPLGQFNPSLFCIVQQLR
jgi:hypothetical protein